MTIILSVLNRFKKFFSLEDSWVHLQLNGYQNSHRTLHILLPCETLMSAKQAVNDTDCQTRDHDIMSCYLWHHVAQFYQ